MVKQPHSPLIWRQWRQLQQTFSPALDTVRIPIRTSTALSNSNAFSRPFHTTHTRSATARQTPSIRRAERARLPEHLNVKYKTNHGLSVDREGFMVGVLTLDVSYSLKKFENMAPFLYDMGTKADMVPPGVNFKTYKTVCEKLIRKSREGLPHASAARSISEDVDAVYRIAQSLFLVDGPVLVHWAMSACAKAKSRRALVEIVNQYTETSGVDIHRNSEWIAIVKDLALIDEFPTAIMLYAKILAWRGQNEQAAKLLEEKILPFIRPTTLPRGLFNDITLNNQLISPLRLYGLVVAHTHGHDATSKAIQRAAIEFGEPMALTDLAMAQMAENNYVKYEEYMAAAAMSGHGKACLYLANYYRRISIGEYSTQEEREAANRLNAPRHGLLSKLVESVKVWVNSIVHKPLDHEGYAQLAIEWYRVAFYQGETAAKLIEALMLREKGHWKEGWEAFSMIDRSDLLNSLPTKAINQLQTRWNDPTFDPGFPEKITNVVG